MSDQATAQREAPEVLSEWQVARARTDNGMGRYPVDRLADSHESLRVRLAEVEGERDEQRGRAEFVTAEAVDLKAETHRLRVKFNDAATERDRLREELAEVKAERDETLEWGMALETALGDTRDERDRLADEVAKLRESDDELLVHLIPTAAERMEAGGSPSLAESLRRAREIILARGRG